MGEETYDANFNATGFQQALYYVHADHLNTPRRLTLPAGNAVVWRWDSDPFGAGSPNSHPAGTPLSAYLYYDLRLPGQIYDSHTGAYYNWFRDYDSTTGRYMQSDPIGLGGGINTYAYVGGNPISNKDPLGLMCTPGVGCYTTPAEAAAAQSGNYLGYYQLACAGGDAYACFAEHVAANDTYLGQLATDRLRDALRKEGCDNDETLNDIRNDLANAYASYLPDNPDNAIWPDAQAIAQFHWDVFGQYGLPPTTFGGTPYSWGVWGAGIWCPNCAMPPFHHK
jgi:RHS repeat-associated protein